MIISKKLIEVVKKLKIPFIPIVKLKSEVRLKV